MSLEPTFMIGELPGGHSVNKKNDPLPAGHTINVAFRELTRFNYSHIYGYMRKNALPPDVIVPNLLTKFDDDQTINVTSRVKTALPLGGHSVASRVLTRKNAPTPSGHVYIIRTNLLTKFHDNWTMNVVSRVFTRFYYSYIKINAPPPCRPCFSTNHIIGTNLLTKFHEDRTINVAYRVLTRKNAPPPGGHTKFHDDWNINVASRVLTRASPQK
ncbi:hypothetical protein DPMN_155951 [Dreissena polymorpha]|uniref:Uncharacterized protein n=1 Tax=Dreissena polymorpha TaxID=45954 RepID=A0A9D4JBE2_DREPO|nr:hypothetical protein DPMN_155951 [Dreissena polymorpha]